MSAPVLTLSTASSPASSSPYLSSSNQGTPSHSTAHHHPNIDPDRHPLHALATLSRNASVISTSSSSSSSSSITPPVVRPRPIRTFSRDSTTTARARSPPHNGYPRSPTTPTRSVPISAAYLPRALSPDPLRPGTSPPTPTASRPASRAGSRQPSRPPNSRSRSNSNVVQQQQQRALTADDFDFGEILGSGSYSSVMAGVHRTNGQTYAIKVIDKAHIIRYRKVKYANIEKTCLVRLGTGKVNSANVNSANTAASKERNHQRKASGLGGGGGGSSTGHPGVIRMHWTFHDDTSLYFVLDLAPNGELNSLIRKLGSFSYEMVKYYTAQLVDTLGYIHNMNILHRDVKPENVLLDAERRIKITDFGSAKLLDEEKPAAAGEEEQPRASSFVGSSLYVSPELLTRSYATKASDVWALGSIIFYMISGDPPFKSMSEFLTFERIKHCDYAFPPDGSEHAFDPEAKDLIQQIFNLDPAERITTQQIRAHPFLSTVDWTTLWTDPAPAPASGTRKPPPPPPKMSDVFDSDDDDDDVNAMWNKFVGVGNQASDSEEEEEEDGPLAPPRDATAANPPKEEKEDPELQRVRRMYGNLNATDAKPVEKPVDSVEKVEAGPSTCPVVQEETSEDDSTSKEDNVAPLELGTAPAPLHHVLSPVVEEEPTPRFGTIPATASPPLRQRNSGFVVVSRPGHHQHTASSSSRSGSPSKRDRRAPSVSIDPSVASTGRVPPPPGSASSATSSEGSPLEPVSAHPTQHGGGGGGGSTGLGLFTRVWGKGTRRGSTSSTTAPACASSGGGGGDNSGLGLSVWSRRASFGTKDTVSSAGTGGRRLSPDFWGNASRRMSNTSGHGTTRSSSNSRRGSRSGSVVGIGGLARGEMGKWSSMFLPGEQVIFHSSLQSRTRHGLLPSKRRILVLTDLPRLLLVKEYPARSSSNASTSQADAATPTVHMPFAGDIVVKAEILFSAATSTLRPPILSKISERGGENGNSSGNAADDADGSEQQQLDSSTDEAAVPPSRPSRRPSFVRGSSASRVGTIVLRGVDAKGDKCFALKTNVKTYTFTTDDAKTTSQWVREIEEARSSMQNEMLLGVPSSS
ncbi:pkb-activating kinase-like protein [Tulasnella sp. 427]|nr:pkb-activating kinase-like protein [Tulasnella sp. 427]